MNVQVWSGGDKLVRGCACCGGTLKMQKYRGGYRCHSNSSRCQPRTSQSRNYFNVFQAAGCHWTCSCVFAKVSSNSHVSVTFLVWIKVFFSPSQWRWLGLCGNFDG